MPNTQSIKVLVSKSYNASSLQLCTPVATRVAVGGGRIEVGGLPAPGTTDPLRLIGRPVLEGGRWLAIICKTNGHKITSEVFNSSVDNNLYNIEALLLLNGYKLYGDSSQENSEAS